MGRKKKRDLDKLEYGRVYARCRYEAIHKRGYKAHSQDYKEFMASCMDEEAIKEKRTFISMAERMKEQEQQAQRRKQLSPRDPDFEKGEPIFRSSEIIRHLPRGMFEKEGERPLTTLEKEEKVTQIVRKHGKVDYDTLMRMLEEEEENE